MATLLCSTNCGTATSVPAPFGNNCGVKKRRFGFSQMIFVKCDFQFTDILDTSEWQTAIANSDIHATPLGILSLPAPTQASFDITGCGLKETGNAIYQLNWQSYDTDDDLADFDYYKSINNNAAGYRVMWIDCNGNVFMEDDFAAAIKAGGPATVLGQNPGYEFSVTQVPYPEEGEENQWTWNMQLEIEIPGVLCAAQIPGLEAILD